MTPIDTAWREAVLAACREAAAAIRHVRGSPEYLDAVRKQDGTLVSAADHAASRILGERLAALDAAIPVVCEEGGHEHGGAARFWLVDPLDGTREFVHGSDAYSINVALVEDARAVFGVLHFPVDDSVCWGGPGLGAWRDGRPIRARTPEQAGAELRVLVSPAEARQARERCAGMRIAGRPLHVDPMPGAVKFCLVASGEADFYPRSAIHCAWDAAAGQAILEGAGGVMYGEDWQPMRYHRSAGWYNGPFVAQGASGSAWKAAFPVW